MTTTLTERNQNRGTRSGNELTTASGRERVFNRVCVGVLVAFSLLWLVPLLWALDTSLKPEGETTKVPVTWLIDSPTLAAYAKVLDAGNVLQWYANSFIISILVAALSVVTASMAAFALSRIRFRGSNAVFWVILAGIMIPGQALIVPLFREFAAVGMIDTYWAVILPQIAAPVAVFVFKQFFDGIPRELEEAALVDGASRFHIFSRIFLPLSRPAISAVSIFTFVWSWNNFLWPLLVLTSTPLMTLPVGLATVSSAYGIQYASIMASAILGALPLLVVFLLFQRRIVEGIAGTGLKG
ncbi:multiple sugar transport system permease protein [Actinopolymorpha cephalotaxi]|uniref:Multiple sugar transport system permease protein n=1 Tax=Actinopolymorpha cephalotaxi TaxID=504797 RepID=A0A1I2KHM1_9ACTN|nr:carbohydrate ABC transporter permease [Actinopolymorpha cephalotaxi]NYH81189.1 multiple sugar transport system permease protein [Actinopolymorpha cephalotaxi]SFF65789.1 multiple sugar transport system permease protein [Actinopolymorpha cephalotaxi]